MWPFDRTRWTHWIPLVLVIVFLVSYFGFLPWGTIGDALESLAEKPTGAEVFHTKIDRADAIFMVFVFLFLTPLALVAVGGLVAFIGTGLAGMLEAIFHRPGLPGWIFTLLVYLVVAVVAYSARAAWVPHAQGLASLLARALIVSTR